VSDWLSKALQINGQRRKIRFAEGQQAGMVWMLECRDMWDAHDADGGVYFSFCATEAEVDEVVNKLTDDDMSDRLLGIYNLSEPLNGQGAGINRTDWRALKSS
jgi:hypothetical protein